MVLDFFKNLTEQDTFNKKEGGGVKKKKSGIIFISFYPGFAESCIVSFFCYDQYS